MQTSLSQIAHLPTTANLEIKLNSGHNSPVNLYNYPKDVYEFIGVVEWMGVVVGLIAMGFIIIGCVVPGGKVVLVEALAVVQVAYFSLVLGFDKIPPTYTGLRWLGLGSGFNDWRVWGEGWGKDIGVNEDNGVTVAKVLGVNVDSMIESYNLTFIVLVGVPIVVGLIGLLVSKWKVRCYWGKEERKDEMMKNRQEEE